MPTAPPRILLANEFGAGRGHLVTLRQVAAGFGPGFVFDAALARRTHQHVLAEIGADIYDGPRLRYDTRRRVGPEAVATATWGDFLGDLGFDRETRLVEVLGWWRHVIQSRKVAAVVADYAPLALLAARSLGVATVAVGTGYGLPPAEMAEFPILCPEISVRLHDEATLLGNVNRAVASYGFGPLAALPEVYRADLTLVRSLALLDPYGAQRRGAYCPPLTQRAAGADEGTEVFVYFSTTELADPAVVEALVRLPLPRRGYLPGAPPGVAARLAASGMVLEPAPLAPAQIAARTRLVLSAGQHGILSLALFAGLPQVCVPQHREQDWHARAAHAAGVAQVLPRAQVTTERLVAMVQACHADPALRASAKALARRLHDDLPDEPHSILAERLRPLAQGLRG